MEVPGAFTGATSVLLHFMKFVKTLPYTYWAYIGSLARGMVARGSALGFPPPPPPPPLWWLKPEPTLAALFPSFLSRTACFMVSRSLSPILWDFNVAWLAACFRRTIAAGCVCVSSLIFPAEWLPDLGASCLGSSAPPAAAWSPPPRARKAAAVAVAARRKQSVVESSSSAAAAAAAAAANTEPRKKSTNPIGKPNKSSNKSAPHHLQDAQTHNDVHPAAAAVEETVPGRPEFDAQATTRSW